MLNLDGDMISIIHTPTNSLNNSVNFYTALGYQRMSVEPCLFRDGDAIIEVNPDRYARAGLKLVKESWEDGIQKLDGIVNLISTREGLMFSDPSGVWIYLSAEGLPFALPESQVSQSILGNFAGICIETGDMDRSVKVYEALGYSITSGTVEQGYVVLESEGTFPVSLMQPLSCPHLFFNPSMTYFNGGNNPAIIENIRRTGIPIAEEITHFNKEGLVDNVVLRDPGGYGIFVFND